MPPPGPPELAFAGRSNVGKSSAINALTGRKRLAFTSKTPGRTQTINFFELGAGARLVDLPGYGYAKVPHAVRAGWRTLVGSYVGSRATLAGVVLVMDARHPLTELDLQLVEFLGDVRLLALLSKADKLSRPAQAKTLSAVSAAMKAEVRAFLEPDATGCRRMPRPAGALARLACAPADRWNKKPPVKGNKPGVKTP